MLELHFEIEGEDLLYRRLMGISEKLADWRSTFAKTGYYLKKTFRDNFLFNGDLLEKRWAPLKLATILAKRRKGQPDDPLIGSGKMMESFASDPQKMYVRVYNPVEYFKYHQSNKPRRVIPRRVMISLTEKMRQQVIKFFQSEIEEALRYRA